MNWRIKICKKSIKRYLRNGKYNIKILVWNSALFLFITNTLFVNYINIVYWWYISELFIEFILPFFLTYLSFSQFTNILNHNEIILLILFLTRIQLQYLLPFNVTTKPFIIYLSLYFTIFIYSCLFSNH